MLFQAVLCHSSLAFCSMLLLLDKFCKEINGNRGLSGLIFLSRVTFEILISNPNLFLTSSVKACESFTG